jgi:hypothetical protein
VEQKINMKKIPHKRQIEMLLGLHRFYFERINIEWENHLEFIKWNKTSEFYEPFEVFSIRYLWEIIKERDYTDITCFNTLVNYVEENAGGWGDCISHSCKLPELFEMYLDERLGVGWKRFEKEFHNSYYVIEPIKYKSGFGSKPKRNINWENIFLKYILGGFLIIILTPILLMSKYIYSPISNLIYKYKHRNDKYYFYD